MKRYYAAAAALLLGTSALAWAAEKPIAVDSKTAMSWDKSALSVDKSLIAAKSDVAMASDSKLEYAAFDKAIDKLALVDSDAKLALGDSDAKLQTAAYTTWADSKEAKLQTASYDSWSDGKTAKVETASMEDGKLETAWADSDAKIQTASYDGSYDKSQAGMGGPLEEPSVATTTVVQPGNADPEHDARGIPVISDVAYVPPGYNGNGAAVGGPVEAGDEEAYPACSRERTDNCIQLYERGVRASLASRSAGDSTAMGGPYEPAGTDLAMNGDGEIDAAKGETVDGELKTAAVTDTSLAMHGDHQGVGGPVEAQSGYPPCSPGPGDDRCIQLYESGVTGAGN